MIAGVRQGSCIQIGEVSVTGLRAGDVHTRHTLGALDGGSPMSHVDFKKSQCPVSLRLPCPVSPLRYPNVACRFLEMAHVVSFILISVSLGSMSHVDFEKRPCRPVDFRGQGPYPHLTAPDLHTATTYPLFISAIHQQRASSSAVPRQRPYIRRRRCTPIHYLCDAYLGIPYPSY